MNLAKSNLTIRNAMASDARQLCDWWNDGRVMAHAGFPNGVNTTVEEVRKNIASNDDEDRLHIIEVNGKPIGEMSYGRNDSTTAGIGIKICDSSHQEKGLGTTLLSMFIDALFTYYGYEKIWLDTNAKNKRAQHVYGNKLGFKVTKTIENAWQDQLGQWQSSVEYELTKKDWLARTKEPLGYIHIRQERPADHYTVEELTRDAFWCNNWEPEPGITDVHLLVHRLRGAASFVPELSLVAEVNGQIAGHIIYTVSKIVSECGTEHEMLTFGPLSVHPLYQNKGIGKALMNYSFKVAKELGYKGILIFGHPDYYPRVGFRRAAEFGITTPDGANFDPFMAYPLYDGAFDGISGKYYIDPIYDALTMEDAQEFDKKFPPKPYHVPVLIDVLLARLQPAARQAIEETGCKTLNRLSTKSEREMRAIEGIDHAAIETIRTVMGENSVKWGEKK